MIIHGDAIKQLELPKMNKLKEITAIAIERLRMFEPPEGYYLAFSGGKDSQTIYHLAKEAGVKFDAHFHMTTIDPPEVLQFIRDYYPDVEWDRPFMTMFAHVAVRGFPTRLARWCCNEFKEVGGDGRFVITGIRWAESTRRKNRSMTELCNRHKGKRFLHPIIDWSQKDVWGFLNSRGLSHCSLYDEGFKRIGCVLCPMATYAERQGELLRFPKLCRAWRIAFERLYARGTGGVKRWSSAEEMWQWWLSRKGQSRNKAQAVMFE